MKRRAFLQTAFGAAGTTLVAVTPPPFALRYMMGSCMYGEAALEVVLQACQALKTSHLDVWPRRHGNQREQLELLGHEKASALFRQYGVQMTSISRFDLGAFKLREEVAFAASFGTKMLVTGTGGPKDLSGDALKQAIRAFAEKVKPELDHAASQGVTITLENHSNTTFCTPDSFGWLMEALEGFEYGIELAPYHLPQDPELIARLIRDLGPRLQILCAWEYGKGCMKPMPKEEELEQMPGRGALDFGPIVRTLRDMNYQGYTMVFMHPTPRGIAVMPTVEESTAVIAESMKYLDSFIKR